MTDSMHIGFAEWTDRLGVRERVTWRGRLPWHDVMSEDASAGIFLFTSLRDSVGVQVLEAMAWGLPVVILDHQGAANLGPVPVGPPPGAWHVPS